jgi:hypothetical protein
MIHMLANQLERNAIKDVHRHYGTDSIFYFQTAGRKPKTFVALRRLSKSEEHVAAFAGAPSTWWWI